MTPEQEAELARLIEARANQAAASLAPTPLVKPPKSDNDEDLVNGLLAQTEHALIRERPIKNYQ